MIEVHYQSDIGKARDTNEDYVGVFTSQSKAQLLLVADGVGGMQGGEVASEMTVETMGEYFEKSHFTTAQTALTWLEEAITKVNQAVKQRSQDYFDLRGMGTTLVALLFVENQVVVAHIGDSRAYLLRQQRFSPLTQDHTFVSQMVRLGEMSEEEAKKHPKRHWVTRAVGVEAEVEFDYDVQTVQPGDRYLLCSDGLTNLLTPSAIKHILLEPLTLADQCQALIDLTNQAGGTDNITVLLAAVPNEVKS
ncbi:Stp1/IreP family PP2C-type Ser/Thr phosphatase [Ligilactobacillus ceti]|uniref:protein-serine/threonine phosphatase n=1 Tax=Ligilactobacillus ceti DSM 22408 TaxID=1122146 RepID=A0A0R2KGT2_9LACO|nr:Stp1/IreP family PP2C-type Ser/Thr phosphatase [Ligilactobacillus ceti]KRN88584.1 serine threonine protein phosphatase 1 [Ligilactobacillus ceti DSM 22408]